MAMPQGERHYCMCRSTATDRFMICCDKCNDWFHGDCVQISQTKSKTIRQFFCPPCRDKDPSLQIVYKGPKEKKPPLPPPPSLPKPPPKRPAPTNKCGQCIGCFRSDDCGKCASCRQMTRFGGPGPDVDIECRQRVCVNKSLLVTQPEPEPPRKMPVNKGRPKASKPKMKNVVRSGPGRTPLPGTRSGTKAYEAFMREAGLVSSDDDDDGVDLRQCVGPLCVKQARKSSKYCSDECGLEMAKKRLLTVLPGRIEKWNKVPSAADKRDKENMEKLRINQQQARERLTQLEAEEQSLETWLQASSKVPVDISSDQQADDNEGDDVSIYCPVCGMETAVRSATKHIARCSAKYESQASYGSAFKATSNPYNIFCDTYNKQSRTYCKRLRVICPEHSKDKTWEDKQICAYPLNWDGFKLPTIWQMAKSSCRIAKKKCMKHYQWDKTTKALIDLSRLTQLLKLDELFEQERTLRLSMAARGSVLALIMNETTSN